MLPFFEAKRPPPNFPPSMLADDYETWAGSWTWKSNNTSKDSSKPLRSRAYYPGWGPSPKIVSELPTPPDSPERYQVSQFETVIPPNLTRSSSSSLATASSAPPSSPAISWSPLVSATTSAASSFSSWDTSAIRPEIVQPPILFCTEFFEVRKSPKGGYGAFANQKIAEGTVVMKEKPLIKTTAHDLYMNLDDLTDAQRKEFSTLHYWSGADNSECNWQMARFKTNRFEITASIGGIFIKSSRFNHACREFRNCKYQYHPDEDCLIFTASQAIQKDEEITICYNPNPAHLYEDYGFYCDCPGCPSPKEARKQAELNRDKV